MVISNMFCRKLEDFLMQNEATEEFLVLTTPETERRSWLKRNCSVHKEFLKLRRIEQSKRPVKHSSLVLEYSKDSVHTLPFEVLRL